MMKITEESLNLTGWEDFRKELAEREANMTKAQKIMREVNRKRRKAYSFLRYDIPQGIKSIIKWSPVIWKDRDWDWEYILLILKFKLREMEKLQARYGSAQDSYKYAEQLRIAQDMIRDILEADEWENISGDPDVYVTEEQLAIEIFFEYVAKNLRGWWD